MAPHLLMLKMPTTCFLSSYSEFTVDLLLHNSFMASAGNRKYKYSSRLNLLNHKYFFNKFKPAEWVYASGVLCIICPKCFYSCSVIQVGKKKHQGFWLCLEALVLAKVHTLSKLPPVALKEIKLYLYHR